MASLLSQSPPSTTTFPEPFVPQLIVYPDLKDSNDLQHKKRVHGDESRHRKNGNHDVSGEIESDSESMSLIIFFSFHFSVLLLLSLLFLSYI